MVKTGGRRTKLLVPTGVVQIGWGRRLGLERLQLICNARGNPKPSWCVDPESDSSSPEHLAVSLVCRLVVSKEALVWGFPHLGFSQAVSSVSLSGHPETAHQVNHLTAATWLVSRGARKARSVLVSLDQPAGSSPKKR